MREGAFQQLSASDYLAIFNRRKWWIILCTIGFLITATVAARRIPNSYRAETVILVDPQQVPDKYVPVINPANIGDRLATLQQQVLSPTRLKSIVEEQGLYPDGSAKTEDQIVHAVQKSISIEVVNPGGGKMGAFRIAYQGRKRTEVATIANRLAQLFVEENLKARERSTAETTEFLESQLEDTKRQLDQKDAELQAIKSRNIMDLPESKPYHLEALANLRTQIQATQDKISQAQRDKSMLESMAMSGGQAPTVDIDPVDGAGGGPGGQTPYQAQVQKLESKLAELRTRYGSAHPEVRAVQGELDRLKAKGDTEAQNGDAVEVSAKPAIQPDPKHRNPVLEAQIGKLGEEIEQQSALLKPLQEQMDFHTSKLQEEPVFEQQLARLTEDYDALKAQYAALLDKKQAAEMSHALELQQQGERFVILDPAVTPEAPAAPNRPLISLAGLVAGLLAGIALAAVADLNDESIKTESEAVKEIGTSVLGCIPYVSSVRERWIRRWQAVAMLMGTALGSVVLGFVLSVFAERFF